MIKQDGYFFRTTGAGNLTTTTTSSAIDIGTGGTPQGGLGLEIHLPSGAANGTLRPVLEHSTDGSTFTTLLSIDTYSVGGSAQVGSKSIIARFVTRLRYVRLVLTTGGSGPNFGAASAAISLDAPQYLPIGGAVTSPL